MGETMRGIALSIVLIAVATAGGCKAAQPRPDRLATARVEGVARAHADDATYVVRLNPAGCDCAKWEVRLDGTWYRAFLEPDEPGGPVEAARTALEDAAARGDVAATVTLAGKLKGTRLAANRAPSLVLKVADDR